MFNNSFNRIAIRYNNTRISSSFLNGSNIGDLTTTMIYPPLTDKINLGAWFGNSLLNMRLLAIFPAGLTDEEMIALTTL